MARSVILGNGGLTVGLNESGFVHDFYYPYVGLENLTTARSQPHHIGVWVDGSFSWLDSSEWHKDIQFHSDALIGDSTFTNEKLEIVLHFEDFVDSGHDIFARKIRVVNNKGTTRDMRLFFHQVFQISAQGRADTVMYVPDGHYLLDYKGRCSILAYAQTEDGVPFDQYAVGNAGIEGKEGTFRDAEDGELSMSAVEHASVDSTIRVCTTIAPHDSVVFNYWLAVADSQDRLESMHTMMLGNGFDKRLEATINHWHEWLATAESALTECPDNDKTVIKKSLLVIKAHIDEHGGIIASCDSSIYNYGRDYYSYVWPRDGAFVLWPLIRLGYTKEPRKFFEFCASILHPDGYLKHKYQPDRAVGSTWHPLVHNNRKELAIQEDETAIVLYMLGEYQHFSQDTEFIDSMYETFIHPAAEFLCRFMDETGLPHASYDLWEEKFLTSTYTTAVTYAALKTAAKIANERGISIDAERWDDVAYLLQKNSLAFFSSDKGHLIKGFLYNEKETQGDLVLDVSSFYGAFMFDFLQGEPIEKTLKAIEEKLLNQSPSGGSPRYENDMYFRSEPAFKGNPWFVTTLWLAQYYALHNRIDDAWSLVTWAQDHMLPSGLLSEQIHPKSGDIVGVTPLVWSHAELVNTLLLLYSEPQNVDEDQ